ncbi:MAG: nuclear transport factor 2 family protein [Candidatus Acidiferrales bacterium]
MKRAWGWLAILAAVATMWMVSSRRSGALATASDEARVRKVLDDQVAAWNRGDIETFMTGYWKSDQVQFVGGNGITRGYSAVLARYKKNYPTQAQMGTLTFSDLEIHQECADSAYAIGQFHLELPPDNPSGFFTLNFKKFANGWKIVVDHTSPTPKKPAN